MNRKTKDLSERSTSSLLPILTVLETTVSEASTYSALAATLQCDTYASETGIGTLRPAAPPQAVSVQHR